MLGYEISTAVKRTENYTDCVLSSIYVFMIWYDMIWYDMIRYDMIYLTAIG